MNNLLVDTTLTNLFICKGSILAISVTALNNIM